jgi:hypothetical protein
MARLTSSLFWLALLTGCGDAKPDTGPESGTVHATIYALHQGEHAAGSSVELHGVVASSPVSDELRAFFVQEQAGGEYSGIRVVVDDDDELPTLAVGDLVDFTATVLEIEDGVRLELDSGAPVEVTGTGSLAPEPLSAPSDWGPWGGVLVELSSQVVQGCPDGGVTPELSSGLILDDAFSGHDSAAWLTSFATITGPVDLQDGGWSIFPRSSSDLGEQSDVASCAAVIQAGVACEVTLEGLVVTSSTDRVWGGIFAQDTGGGEHSGIWITDGDERLEVGQVIDASGTVNVSTDEHGSQVWLYTSDLVATGETATPSATVLDGAPDDWWDYESALVTLQGVEITSDPSGSWWVETDQGVGLVAWLTTPLVMDGDSCASITGFPSYAGDGEMAFAPRSAEEIDCDGAPVPATISQVRQGEAEGLVSLEGVVASSSPSLDSTGFFVQDAGGGEYAGIWVYYAAASWDGAPQPEVQPGDLLNLTGFSTEYYGQSELLLAYVSELETTGSTTPVATELSAAPFDWEPYEGVLVTLFDLSLDSEVSSYGEVETSWSGIWMDDLLYDWTGDYGEGDVFSQATGPVYYSWYEYRLMPRDDDDLIPASDP